MGLQLPGELRSVLSVLGYDFPAADEVKLFEMGGAWISFSEKIGDLAGESDASATVIWQQNQGPNAEAFQRWWTDEDSPKQALSDGTTAAVLTGTGLIICGAIVLILKVSVIVQLIILAVQIAQAIATAAVTFGASLAEIPIFQQISRTVIGNLIQEVLFKLVDG